MEKQTFLDRCKSLTNPTQSTTIEQMTFRKTIQDATNVNLSTIQMWETGAKTPGRDNRKKIADALCEKVQILFPDF